MPQCSPPMPGFPTRFFITDARFPPPDLKNCDRSPNKISKIERQGRQKSKRRSCHSPCQSPSQNISELRNRRQHTANAASSRTPQTPQLDEKPPLFRYTRIHFTRHHRVFTDNRKPHSRTQNSHTRKQTQKALSFTTKT